jgi:hypothetical protein
LVGQVDFCLGFPARSTRNEKPRPFSKGSTIAVTSSTGYSPQLDRRNNRCALLSAAVFLFV